MSYTDSQLQAIQEVLQSLLDYEGGEMQSMAESVGCSIHNLKILNKAKDLGVVLNATGLGRK